MHALVWPVAPCEFPLKQSMVSVHRVAKRAPHDICIAQHLGARCVSQQNEWCPTRCHMLVNALGQAAFATDVFVVAGVVATHCRMHMEAKLHLAAQRRSRLFELHGQTIDLWLSCMHAHTMRQVRQVRQCCMCIQASMAGHC